MTIGIEPYRQDFIPAVKCFNARLNGGGVPTEFRFPENHIPNWLPRRNGEPLYQEYFLALENGEVRGGYILKHQKFFVRGELKEVGYYHLPLSEGIVNKTYVSVGAHMLRHALKTQPLLFALGMGGFDRPLPRMLKAMGWSMCTVPFYFRVNRPKRFLHEVRALRKTAWRRFLFDLAALTGTGWLGLTALQVLHRQYSKVGTQLETVNEFTGWADDLVEKCRERYAMLGQRDQENLNLLYPRGSKFLCLRVARAGRMLGWAVLLDTQMREHRYFGNLRVGTIVDSLALPEDALPVISAASQFLQERGTDMVVSNQSHETWYAALKSAGFLRGPSNFIFAASQALSGCLRPFATNCTKIHFNRGDGDGPINL